MFDTFSVTYGFESHHDIASLVLRLVLGIFFSISGYHKLFNATRRANLRETFKADGCYSPALMFVIPIGELLGGIAVLIGFLTPIASLGLILICLGACVFDGLKRIPSFKPLDRADYAADVLYLPEFLYIAKLSALVIIGPGLFSIDSLLRHLIH